MRRLLLLLTPVLACLLPCWRAPAALAAAPSRYSTTFGDTGITGWTGQTNGWQTTSGVLTFDGHTNSEILAPTSTKGLHDFAVEAQIQSLGTATAQAFGYGVVVRSSNKVSSGVRGGMGLSIPESATEPQLTWGSDGAGGSLVQVQPGFNTFRIDVHGADYDLSIDGIDAVHLRIDAVKKGVRVGLWSGRYALKVSSFRIIRLQTVTAPSRLPPVKKLDIQPTDLPKSLHRYFGHYWTNDEYSRANLVPLADLIAGGRLITYESGYLSPTRTGFYAAAGFLAVFKNAGKAAAAFSPAAIRASFAALPKYTEVATPHLGTDAFRMSFEFQDNNGPIADVDCVFFHTGRYLLLLYGDFSLDVPAATQTKDIVAAATAVRARIQAAS